MVRGKRSPREAVKWAENGDGVSSPPASTTGFRTRARQQPSCPERLYRLRSLPQTAPLATRASISELEYPNSVSTSVVCWLNFGGTLRRLGLLRSRRIGEATPLYQSFSMTSPR